MCRRGGLTDTQNLSNGLDLISKLSSRTNELARDVDRRTRRGPHAQRLERDGSDGIDHGEDSAAVDRLQSAASSRFKAHVVVVEVFFANSHARVDGTRNGLVDDHLYVSVQLQGCRHSAASRNVRCDIHVLQHRSILAC